jgi:TATA-binding protein-associated factor Taf7
LARRSLKPQLNQIRTWVRQGRTDAWIAHQLEVSVGDIRAFKREHELVPDDAGADGDEGFAGQAADDLDLRAEDDARVAAALEAEQVEEEEEEEEEEDEDEEDEDEDGDEDKPRRRRRGRRGGRGRRRTKPRELEGTFDHGEEGYGLWLDPAVQDDPVYAEHWAGHRPVTVTVEPERIVITRTGEEPDDSSSD